MKWNNQVSWNTIGQISSLFFQWLIIVLLPRITDFTEAGIYSIAISITSIFYTIASCYLHQVQLADRYTQYTENNFLVTRIVTIAVGFTLLGVSLIFLDYSYTQNLVIVAYMIYRNILNVAYVFAGTIEIHNHFDYAGKVCAVEGVVSFSVFVLTYVYLQDIVLSTVLMAIIGGASYLILIMIGRKRFLDMPLDFSIIMNGHVKELLIIGFMTLISAISPIVITALPKLILNEYTSEEVVGIFSTLSAPTVIISTIVISMFAPFIGTFSEMARRGDIRAIRGGFYKTAALIIMLGLLAALLSLFIAPPFFSILYGSDMDDYIGYFAVLVIGMVFYSLGMVNTNILIAKSQTRISSIAAIISMLTSFAIMIIAIPSSAMDGAVFGLTASYGIFGLITSLCVVAIPLKRGIDPNVDH